MMNAAAHAATTGNRPTGLRPMPFWQAVLFFGLPALLFRLCLYNAPPALIALGLSRFHASVVSFTIPAAVLLALALGFCKRDGYAGSWSDIQRRLRLVRMSGKDWLWAILGLLLTFLSIGAIQQLTVLPLIKAFPAIAPPAFFPPWIQPGVSFDAGRYADYIGAPLKGNWGVAALVLIMLFFNVFGEELWWRGYILPRQEQAHGRGAWLVNGLLWLLWHAAFYPWQIFALLPICLAVPFVAQRRQNTWTAILIHLQNGVFQVLILAMVLGLIH